MLTAVQAVVTVLGGGGGGLASRLGPRTGLSVCGIHTLSSGPSCTQAPGPTQPTLTGCGRSCLRPCPGWWIKDRVETL